MSYHDDLLEQASHLLRRDPRKPKQANLHRAVSTAYYALFHLLVDDAVNQFLKGAAWRLRGVLRRVFEHGTMREASRSFASGNLPAGIAAALTGPLPPALQAVADAFGELQQARHEADYDVWRNFSRADVENLIERTETAFVEWRAVRGTEAARSYLVALLAGSKLGRR